MNEALERLRASRQATVELPSGLNVTIRLLRMQDFIRAGDVPMPVLEEIEKLKDAEAEGEDESVIGKLTLEQLKHAIGFDDTIVRLTIIAIEGEPVELTDDDVKLLEARDCHEVLAYAMRIKALPGKAA
jgi:hypothetical protein